MNYFEEMCILCLGRNKNIKSISLQDEDGTVVEEKLEYVLPELVIFKAHIPDNICTDCLKNLNYVHKFKEKCLHNLVSLSNKIKILTAQNKKYKSHNFVKNSTVTKIEDVNLLCEAQIEESPGIENIEIDTNDNDRPYVELSEEKQNAIFEEVHIKEEPKEIHHEIDIKEDPLVNEALQTENILQNEETHNTEYVPPHSSYSVRDHAEVIPDAILGRTAENLLPKKSKEAYDKEFEKFDVWISDNCIQHINEAVLLRYFEELSESFSPNSLWTKFSMLKKTLSLKKNVDIGKFHKLWEYLKESAKGYEAKKSKVLTRQEVLQFFHEAPNEIYLMVKVALLFGIFGGCRRQELVNMLVEHVEDRGSVVVVSVLGTRTEKKRVFTIIEEKEINSLELIREYTSLRPQCCSERRFFLSYRNGRCTAQPVGKNTFGKIPTTIATFLNLTDAEKYTGHCLRRTSASILSDAGPSTLKRPSEWKSTDFLEGCLEDSITSRSKVSRIADVPSISNYF